MSLSVDEAVPVKLFPSNAETNKFVAQEIANLIMAKAKAGQPCVLGLATGSTPTGVYAELVRLHREEGLSFANVTTFNLDEYFPMQPTALQSYVRFMKEHLFDHIDINPKNINIPDGTIAIEDVPAYCAAYEQKIKDAGGVDLQLLGIGRTGHVGFNEPGSSAESKTRLITLDRMTRLDAASDFFGEQFVPRRAITMGVGTILAAKRIILMAFGEGKSKIIARTVEGEPSPQVPATFLQRHTNVLFCIDEAAGAQLTRLKSPWLVPTAQVEWTEANMRKAVIWLSRQVKKPILHLVNEDYNENGLSDLLALHGAGPSTGNMGGAYEINIKVFRAMQATITGWPGGKPDHLKQKGDISRPTDKIWPKRVCLFSPHPDDDVISMGGTLIRLADQGHEVHIAYQTSGNIAVFDHDAIRFADFARDFNRLFNIDQSLTDRLEAKIEDVLKNKAAGSPDAPEVQKIKGLIRRGEAKAGARECGVPDERCHFMDLPFYETGLVKKKPIGPEDVKITVDLLREIKPHQIYAAGDLSDPHGTHRVCLTAIFKAIDVVRNDDWFKDCEIWLYRGAWQEWEPEQIEMAVPLSPDEIKRKKLAIFRHQSQKDKAMFPGSDQREFWQRAEDRNKATAVLYDQLGLSQYAAIEGFVRWYPPAAPSSTTAATAAAKREPALAR